MQKKIIVTGAKEHNLKNIDVSIPKDQLVVITGVSGSGKSSLAFDTLYAEGQRRFVESLSSYARQFLDMMQKPSVESIEGLSPAISIEQKSISKNPRSTVGTVTEIYDYLRLLFARVGVPYSPATGLPIESQTITQMADRIQSMEEGSKLMLLAPIVRGRKGEYKQEISNLVRKGFQRVKIDGKIYDIEDAPTLDKNKKHDISVVVDRLIVKKDMGNRLPDSIETALNLSDGLLFAENMSTNETTIFSSKFACPVSGFTIESIEPGMFSFNNPRAFCPECYGLGIVNADTEEEYRETCPVCKGTRLKSEALAVKIGGLNIAEVCDMAVKQLILWFKKIPQSLTIQQKEISKRILKEINERLGFLDRVGLNYLSLSRASATLSGGEGQRIKLASQIGTGLTGVLYILDEPSIGLHQRDNDMLLNALKNLRDLGNSVIVVEHDEEAIRQADYIIDMGLGAGMHGGEIIAAGSLEDIEKSEKSLTAQYLSGKRFIPVPKKRRKARNNKWLTIEGAAGHNLKNINVKFPINALTVVTGVSGSGKSTLVLDTLYRAVLEKLRRIHIAPEPYKNMLGADEIQNVINITQSPIGRTPRSNPATYTGAFTPIREWFAELPESKARGYRANRFSFNVKGGRCAACEGDGLIKIEMHFLPDIFVKCETCQGRRYSKETLEIVYKNKNIADVLDMTV
ncbi:MAG: ABC-ATPase UvrA, partial [Alphaproteobacteria bacterium]|nr:ABC-ATPase UvrA [Alphaproteobacteria bacterium]